MMRSAYVLLAVMVAAWFVAVQLIQQFKVSPPAQFERLHRDF